MHVLIDGRQNDYGYGGGGDSRVQSDGSHSVYGIKSPQILSTYGDHSDTVEAPFGKKIVQTLGDGYGSGSMVHHERTYQHQGDGKKFALENLPLIGGLFGRKTSKGPYSSSSSSSGIYTSGTEYESQIVSKETHYSSERGKGQGYGWKSSELEMQSGEKSTKPCQRKVKSPMNAAVKCTADMCRVKCLVDYKFPNGDTVLTMSCVDGEWTIKGAEWDEVPSCEREPHKSDIRESQLDKF